MIRSVITVFLFAVTVTLAQQGVRSKIAFIVRDDDGQPVEDVLVEGGFLDLSQTGARDRFIGKTDKSGSYIATGQAVVGVCAGFSLAGFYSTEIKQPIEHLKAQGGKHTTLVTPEQWNVTVPILLKRIRHQIPMYMREVEYIDIKKITGDRTGRIVTDIVAGFDLVLGALASPYGRGQVSDLELRWKLMIISKDGDDSPLDSSSLFEIRMTNVVDGICRGVPDGTEDCQTGSAFISDYEAPEAGYTNSISFYRNVRGSKVETNDDKHYLYYFRIRTQTNDLGQVTNAFYGKIYGQLNGNFTYYLNPTPNDRNVEHDPKKNLFKGQ